MFLLPVKDLVKIGLEVVCYSQIWFLFRDNGDQAQLHLQLHLQIHLEIHIQPAPRKGHRFELCCFSVSFTCQISVIYMRDG